MKPIDRTAAVNGDREVQLAGIASYEIELCGSFLLLIVVIAAASSSRRVE